MTISKARVLEIAAAAVADRGLNYGKSEDNFNRIAALWNCWIKIRYGEPIDMAGIPITLDAIDVTQMCGYIKDARLANTPNHLDSWVDKAGYAACGANIICEEPTND